MNIPDTDSPRIVVIGAGFAGLKFSRHLNTNNYQLVMIDKHNYHTFQPLLYQVASAGLEPDSIAYPIRKSLSRKKETYIRLAQVNAIDREAKMVRMDIGDLRYDKLVIATGATNNFFGNKEIEERSLPMKTVIDALDLRSKILGNFEHALNTDDLKQRDELMSFVIVGAGPTGVELAGALAELRKKVLPYDFPDLDLRRMSIHLIEGESKVLPALSQKSSEKAEGYLKDLDVHVWTNMMVESYNNNIVKTNKDRQFKCDTLIWAAGVAGTFPEGISKEQIAKGNRLIVNEYCQLKDHENIFVLGDAAYHETKDYPNGLPMLGAVATQQGKYLAKQFNRKAKEKEVQPFEYKDKGKMATVGRNKAVVELKNSKFSGIFAWFTWMAVHLMLLVGYRNRVIVFINWMWNYFRYNNGFRLIIRPFKKKS